MRESVATTSRLARDLPALGWLRDYRRPWLLGDLSATRLNTASAFSLLSNPSTNSSAMDPPRPLPGVPGRKPQDRPPRQPVITHCG
jgi:hypothetical protein